MSDVYQHERMKYEGKCYYSNVNTVVQGNCAVKNNLFEQEIAKSFYVLKRDGSLSILQIGYDITFPNTNWEKLHIFQKLTEKPMTFELDKPRLGSAYLLDFKPVEWEVSSKREYEMLYFKKNYPELNGECESKGESYLVRSAGTGIMEALKELDKR